MVLCQNCVAIFQDYRLVKLVFLLKESDFNKCTSNNKLILDDQFSINSKLNPPPLTPGNNGTL